MAKVLSIRKNGKKNWLSLPIDPKVSNLSNRLNGQITIFDLNIHYFCVRAPKKKKPFVF